MLITMNIILVILLFVKICFTYLWDIGCSIFSGAEKFCLAHVPRQLTRGIKSDVRTPNFIVRSFLHCHEKTRMTFGKGRYAT